MSSQNWRDACILSSASIREALGVIDDQSLRIAVVVESDFTLTGVVTDGDVRRGLLSGVSLDESVSRVMTSDPVTGNLEMPRGYLLSMMRELNLLAIPIVHDKTVVGIETLIQKDSRKNDTPVFIMAGGFGSRLRPLTDSCPKPMLKLGDKPLLEILLLHLSRSGFHNFYISTFYLPEKITNYFADGAAWGVNIHYLKEDTPLGTGGALSLLPPEASVGKIILINGDILTNMDFLKLLDKHEKSDAVATVCVREFEYQIPYGVINGENGVVTGLQEKPIEKWFVNAGIYVLEPAILSSVLPNEYLDMPTLIERELDAGENVAMFPVHEYWLDIGQHEDFKRAQADINNLGLI